MRRTVAIAAVWSELLYQDLGFGSPPRVSLRAFGLHEKMPVAVLDEVEQFVTWERVLEIAKLVWPASDFSFRILSKVKAL
jgi:hypothetical protein